MTLIKVDLTQVGLRQRHDPQPLASGHSRWWRGSIPATTSSSRPMTGPAASSRTTISADDVRDIDLSIVHFLSGPIGVKGAEPGDLLVVDLLDVGPMKESLWGFNGFFSKQNGGGFLTDHFPLAQKSIWDIKGLYTSSRHVPGRQLRRPDPSRPDRLSARSEDCWRPGTSARPR